MAIFITIVLGFGLYLGWQEYSGLIDATEQSRIHVEQIQELLSLLKDAETGQRGYLLTGDASYLKPFEDALPRIEAGLAQLEKRGEPALIPPSWRRLVSDKISEMHQTIQLRREGNTEAALAVVRTNQGKAEMDEIRRIANLTIQRQYTRFRSEVLLARSQATRITLVILLGSTMIVVLLALSALHVSRLIQSRDVLVRNVDQERLAAEHERELFETTLRSIGDAVIASDERGDVRFMNAVAEELTGWKRDEAEGIPLDRIFPIVNETTREPVENPVTKVLREGTIVGLANHTILKRRGGGEIPIDDSGAPIRNRAHDIVGVVLVFRNVAEQRRMQLQLIDSEKRHRLMFETNPQPMWVYETRTLRFLEVNDAAILHYGYSREEFLAATLRDIRPTEDVPALLQDTANPTTVLHTDGPWRHKKKDGSLIWVEITSHPIDHIGRDARFVIVKDITEQKRWEEHLRQSQKLEAIGRLAGGIAHDFNNLLTVIVGYGEMIQREDSFDPELVGEILKAAERASALTRQLLAFSRSQILRPQCLNLNASIMDIANMLRRLLGDDITLVTDLGSEPWDVSADPGQVDQIIINIAVNARDAMERGGTIAIQTKNVHLDDGYSSSHVGVAPGDYVAMSISDTGAGMSEETKARIFEPFFTTKEPGHGTGLGLSTVYGIVKQSGGNIWVYSELGKGTTFTIYLPRFSGDTPRPALPQSAIQEATGREHILIVEDDPTVRTLVAAMLSQCGYTTLAAASGEEALQICADLSVQVDLVVSDLVMPGMDGRDVGRHALELRPGIQLLFMSGYTEHAVLRRNIFEPGIFFLQKPFSHVALARKVREILDGTRAE